MSPGEQNQPPHPHRVQGEDFDQLLGLHLSRGEQLPEIEGFIHGAVNSTERSGGLAAASGAECQSS